MAIKAPLTDKMEKLRSLGALEQFSSARHHLGFYHNVGVSASYSCSTDLSVSLRDIVFDTLAATLEKHPILFAIPINEDSCNPYFVRLPSIALEEAVTFIEWKESHPSNMKDVEHDHILESQHNKGFPESLGKLPFWRLLIITSPDVGAEFTACFIYHHSLGDGTSRLVFHQDLSSALQDNCPRLGGSIVWPCKRELLPNLELICPLQIPRIQKRHILINLWSGEKVTMPTSSHFRSLHLCSLTTRKFVWICREQSTTVTATLPVIVAAVLMKLIPLDFKELECTMPVSLRRWMPAPVTEDAFGVWIDAFSQYYCRDDMASFSWDEARRTGEDINNYSKSGGKSVSVAKFQDIKDMRQFFLSRVGMERGTSFDLSNLGRVNGGIEGGVWKKSRVVFSRSAFVSGSAIAIGVVSGPDQCLSLEFSWQEGIVSDSLVDAQIREINGLVRLA